MTSVLTKPEPNDPVEGQPGHFSHSNWVKASVKALDAACESGAFGVPIGTIVAFSGALNIPANWKICDGTNGTPNLQGRFILGASSSRPAGSAGGVETVTLGVEHMPNHSHSGSVTGSGTHAHAVKRGTGGTEYPVESQSEVSGAWIDSPVMGDGSHTHGVNIAGTGGGQAHENMPPYWALVYIMRVS